MNGSSIDATSMAKAEIGNDSTSTAAKRDEESIFVTIFEF